MGSNGFYYNGAIGIVEYEAYRFEDYLVSTGGDYLDANGKTVTPLNQMPPCDQIPAY